MLNIQLEQPNEHWSTSSATKASAAAHSRTSGGRRLPRRAQRLVLVSAEAAFTPYYALTQNDRSRLSCLTLIDLDEIAAANVPTGMPVQVKCSLSRR